MARYDGPIIDVDVHNHWKKESNITDYLPSKWRSLVNANPRQPIGIAPPNTAHTALFPRMARSLPADGSPGGSDYELLRSQLLDHFNYYRAVLTHDVGDYNHSNPYLAAAMASAANDWNIDQWLSRDDRLYGLIAISTSLPEEAAKEIHRVGKHPRMVGVLLTGNPLGRPYGDPLYHPIYLAAAELGLCISIHSASNFYPNNYMGLTGGTPSVGFLGNSQRSQMAEHYITSYIVNGVFEKFPGLQVLIKELGIAWLPALMWRMDQNLRWFQMESEWVRKTPSEYVHAHIKLSTQPIEVSATDPLALGRLLSTIDGMDRLLCFSSDYPHGTYDDPNYTARQLPASWLRRVFCDNACDVYGWDKPTSEARPRAVTQTA